MNKIICFFIGHYIAYEQDNINHCSLTIETKVCVRCEKIYYVTGVFPQ